MGREEDNWELISTDSSALVRASPQALESGLNDLDVDAVVAEAKERCRGLGYFGFDWRLRRQIHSRAIELIKLHYATRLSVAEAVSRAIIEYYEQQAAAYIGQLRREFVHEQNGRIAAALRQAAISYRNDIIALKSDPNLQGDDCQEIVQATLEQYRTNFCRTIERVSRLWVFGPDGRLISFDAL